MSPITVKQERILVDPQRARTGDLVEHAGDTYRVVATDARGRLYLVPVEGSHRSAGSRQAPADNALVLFRWEVCP